MTPTHHPLYIELVPQSAWFSNLRSELLPREWDAIRKKVTAAANHACQVCGGRGHKHPVECHERWDYDETTHVQTLIGLAALCPACHEATHYGLAQLHGREFYAREQLIRVNDWTVEQLSIHVAQAMNTYQLRSGVHWILDATWLLSFTEVSDKTRDKILAHAKGLEPRDVQAWQEQLPGEPDGPSV